ncbi:hypothetical protein [Inquilinus limosus]|uniref:Uncharacterized protein n=1 Tax=Inquilinus limosus TaxID=171674 RepID=A0A211ZF76_9PROT|nr:hypothetical protein [Inquilinus limosus]OWJ63893.1 hypothetical protein BWR60_27385 [Inquilinus limosus]
MQMLDPRDPILRGPAAMPAGFDDHVLEAELQPVVRAAMQGPFNALVLVRGTLPAGAVETAVETGGTVAVRTNFTLAGFDPERPPAFKHSSTATPCQGAGIDAVDHGFFDESGRWVLLLRGDMLRRHGAVELTSWVMCREEAPAAEDRLAFRSYPFFVPPQPPRPADPWARAVARLYARRPAARAAA